MGEYTTLNTTPPEDLGDESSRISINTYDNGARHVYMLDADGKKRHISHDDVLEAYGYDPADSENPDLRNPGGGAPTPGRPDFEFGESDSSAELAELQRQFTEVQDALAEATAKTRDSSLGRFLKSDSRVGGILGKITGIQWLVNKVRSSETVQRWANSNDEKRQLLGDARTKQLTEQYKNLSTLLALRAGAEMAEAGIDEETAKAYGKAGEIWQNDVLERKIAEERNKRSKKTNKFVNWWVNAKGWKGKLAKAGIVAGGGLLMGAGVGVVGGGYLAATAAGALWGNTIAGYVTKRRANSIDKATGKTLAETQRDEDMVAAGAEIARRHDAGEVTLRADASTEKIDERSDSEVIGNRRRRRAAIGLGVAAAKLGLLGYRTAETTWDNLFGDRPSSNGSSSGAGGAGSGSKGPDHLTDQPKSTSETPTTDGGVNLEVPEVSVPNPAHIDTSGFKYPWNWAENQFGRNNASNMLSELGKRAQADGHSIQWHNSGTHEWIEVDGISNTDHVVNILNQYR